MQRPERDPDVCRTDISRLLAQAQSALGAASDVAAEAGAA